MIAGRVRQCCASGSTTSSSIGAPDRNGASSAHSVAYTLLDVGSDPSDERISMFEDVCFRLRTSNGTFRTSFPQRFVDLDAAASRWMGELFAPEAPIRIQDRAASHCLTSSDWAQRIFAAHSRAEFEASDLFLCLYELSLPRGRHIHRGAQW